MKDFIRMIGSFYIAYFSVVISTALISLAADSKRFDRFIVDYEIVFYILAWVLGFFIYERAYSVEADSTEKDNG